MLMLADAGVLLRGAAAIVFIVLLFAAAAGAVWVARRKLGGGEQFDVETAANPATPSVEAWGGETDPFGAVRPAQTPPAVAHDTPELADFDPHLPPHLPEPGPRQGGETS